MIIDLATSLRRPLLDLDTWIDAGDLHRKLREQGRTLSLVDCVLAAVAIRDALPLWTLDDDFQPLVEDGALVRFTVGRS